MDPVDITDQRVKDLADRLEGDADYARLVAAHTALSVAEMRLWLGRTVARGKTWLIVTLAMLAIDLALRLIDVGNVARGMVP